MRKKVLSVALTAALAFSMTPSAAFAATDIEDHWGQAVLEEWEDYGVIRGYDDGTVRPDAAITRGEMATILDRIMGYQETAENEFSDLSEEDWCMDEMLRAVAAGAFHGDDVDEGEPATIRPNDSISREEAALVVSRVLDLDTENVPDSGFADDSAISDWAEPAVEAMAAAGYVNGYDDGTFRPQGQITRAEVVKIMDNVFANLYQAEGEYTGDVRGSAVIDSDGVVLKDMTISGDLIIAEGVADGHVELDNVTVEGRLIVRGGGENSVVIKGASKIGQIIVDRLGGAVRIAVQDAAEVADVVVSEAVDGVRFEGKVGNLNVQGAASVVEVAGSVDNVEVSETADEAKVTILEGAEAETVKSQAKSATIVVAGTVATVAVSGEGNQLTVSGTVTAVDVAGKDVVVKVEASATVEKVTTSASGTKVEGEGDVESVVAGEGSSDVTVSTEDTKVENNGSGDVAIEGGTVSPGETDTTPGGSTSGGGGVVVPHVHNYVDGVCTAGDGAYDPDWAKVSSAEEWNAAMDGNAEGIVVTADFTANAQLKVSRAVTINGNGCIVTAGVWDDSNPSSKGDAALVSITAGSNSVSIKNITLAGAKTVTSSEVKDYGHGLNVYESSNVTLNNVTLKNNAAAGMVVASSTVNATGLHTSGNGWGGVNVDKASGENPSASKFTFDATSTFTEPSESTPRSAVYSDNGDVTVAAPEGWAKTVVTTGEGEDKDKIYFWAKLFAAGNGTVDSPYEIATAGQFESIVAGSSASDVLYYELSADIDLNGETNSRIDASNISFNGHNHKIWSSNVNGDLRSGVFLTASGKTSISNLTYDLTNLASLINEDGSKDVTALIYQAQGRDSDISISNVTIEGAHSVGSNNGPFVMNEFMLGGLLTLSNCKMAANLSGVGYNACFIGWQGEKFGDQIIEGENVATITLDSCSVTGSLVCPKASIVVANGSNAYKRSYIYEGANVLSGIVRGTEVAEYFTAVSNTNDEAESKAEAAFQSDGGKLFVGQTDNGLRIEVDNNGALIIRKSDNPNVTKYVVRIGLYTNYYTSGHEPAGTWKFFATQTIAADQVDSTSVIPAYDFVDFGYSGLADERNDASGNLIGTIEGETVYIVKDYRYNDGLSELQGYVGAPDTPGKKSPTLISVDAYVGDELYSTDSL